MLTRNFLFTFIVLFIFSCNSTEVTPIASTDTGIVLTQPPLRDKVLSAEEQKALTPDSILAGLKDGNQKFLNNDLTARDHSAMVREAAGGQSPKALILSCLDSRVPVEDVFNEGIGDLFVARVAGNIVNSDLLGSMEFGCSVAGAKLIVVMGHTSCGAIKAAIDNVQLGNITSLVNKIKPAVALSQDFKGEKKSKNDLFVDEVAVQNIRTTITSIREQSEILNQMEKQGNLKIVGALYDLKTGKVNFLDAQ